MQQFASTMVSALSMSDSNFQDFKSRDLQDTQVMNRMSEAIDTY